jgi:hypothetical protein
VKRIERIASRAGGPCQEMVRNPSDIVPSEGRSLTSLACSRVAQFDVEGKLVCRWHAAAIAFDILRKEDRDAGENSAPR